ncbi:Uncharacterised protein [Clostridioides difficile]|nr:Uncharacterised protein [Clostridioides difficile]
MRLTVLPGDEVTKAAGETPDRLPPLRGVPPQLPAFQTMTCLSVGSVSDVIHPCGRRGARVSCRPG